MKYNIISASCKGSAKGHVYQDYIRVYESERCLVSLVADGLGSVVSSSRGSELICKVIYELAVNIDWSVFNVSDFLTTSVSEWYKRLELKGVSPCECCTTCSVILINKTENKVYFAQIGDSPIFYRIDKGRVKIISLEKDFLNETTCIGSSVHPTFSVLEEHFNKEFDFMVTTDGFGDEVVLDAVDNLFDYLKGKYSKIKKMKRNDILKIELNDTMKDINNDDKSIIFGWTYQ